MGRTNQFALNLHVDLLMKMQAHLPIRNLPLLLPFTTRPAPLGEGGPEKGVRLHGHATPGCGRIFGFLSLSLFNMEFYFENNFAKIAINLPLSASAQILRYYSYIETKDPGAHCTRGLMNGNYGPVPSVTDPRLGGC